MENMENRRTWEEIAERGEAQQPIKVKTKTKQVERKTGQKNSTTDQKQRHDTVVFVELHRRYAILQGKRKFNKCRGNTASLLF